MGQVQEWDAMGGDAAHIEPLCEAMHARVYGHPHGKHWRSCSDPIVEYAVEARAILLSDNPDVLDALQAVLVRTERLRPQTRTYGGHGDVWTETRLTTEWAETEWHEVEQP